MSVFSSEEKLCSWAGLVPQSNESAGKKKSTHISRAGVYIKPILVQCANAAIKDKDCPYFKFRYESIKRRRGHKRAIIAIARMLLICVYNMLSKNEAFDYSLYEEYLNHSIEPKLRMNVNKAILFLQSQGFEVTMLDQLTKIEQTTSPP